MRVLKTVGIYILAGSANPWFWSSEFVDATSLCLAKLSPESVADVRIRITPGWEMNVRKEFICAVEEYAGAVENRIN